MIAPLREPLVPVAWPGTYVPNFSDWREGDIVLVHRASDAIGYLRLAASLIKRRRLHDSCELLQHLRLQLLQVSLHLRVREQLLQVSTS